MTAPSCSSRTGALACGLLVLLGSAGALAAPSDIFDIGSGGQPTITGSLGGSVVAGNPSLLSDLVVNIDLGDVSPLNRNAVVRVVVPIAIRSSRDYQLELLVTSGGTGGTLESPQPSDVGFGIQGMQQMAKAKACALASHRITAPFNNDPEFSVNRTGGRRATFPSSLANVGAGAVILQGPELSTGAIKNRVDVNGWRFNAVFVIVPQFFAPGTSWVNLTFRISEAATVMPCL